MAFQKFDFVFNRCSFLIKRFCPLFNFKMVLERFFVFFSNMVLLVQKDIVAPKGRFLHALVCPKKTFRKRTKFRIISPQVLFLPTKMNILYRHVDIVLLNAKIGPKNFQLEVYCLVGARDHFRTSGGESRRPGAGPILREQFFCTWNLKRCVDWLIECVCVLFRNFAGKITCSNWWARRSSLSLAYRATLASKPWPNVSPAKILKIKILQ